MRIGHMKPTLCLFLVGFAMGQNSVQPGIRVISAGSSGDRKSAWSIDGNPLVRGDRVSLIGSVTGRDGASDLILECGAKGWLAYACRSSCPIPVCADKIRDGSVQRVDPLPPEGNPRSQAWLLDVIGSLFSREPNDLVPLGGRGVTVTETPILQDAQGEHWAPALARAIDGSHCFRVSLLPPVSSEPHTFTLSWQHTDSSGITRVSGLRPGLYVMEEGVIGTEKACGPLKSAESAWVLVLRDVDYNRVSLDWDQRSSWLGKLADKVDDPAVISTIRHALLAYWADTASTR